MLNQIAVWVMDIALVLFAVFKVNRGVNRHPKRDHVQLLFNSYQFSLYHSKGSLIGQLLFWLLFLTVFIVINISTFNAILLLSAPLIIWHLVLSIRRFLWRFEVDGHSAFIRTGFVKHHFLLTDITTVVAKNAQFLGVDSGFISHVDLFSGKRRLAKIPAHVMNYHALLNSLSQINTSGVEDLLDELGQPVIHAADKNPSVFERMLLKYINWNPNFNQKTPEAVKLVLLFVVIFFISLTLLIGPLFLDGIISRNAYTAQEVLIGFVIWLSIWTVGIFISRTIFLEGSLFLVQVRKQKGRNIVIPMIFLLATVFATRLGMDMILFHMDNAHFNDIGAAVSDLRAIEGDELGERILNISLDSANERMRSLSPDGEFDVVYRMWFSADWQLYFNFPREHRPADLRVQMLEQEEEIGFRAVNRGQIHVRYTPNMHMITAVELVEPIPLPEIPPPTWHQDEYFLINIDQNNRYPRVAMQEFLRTSPHMEEAMVNHYMTIFKNGVIDYIEREAFTDDTFSFINMEGNQVILEFRVPADTPNAYHQPVRATITFNWEDPVPLDASAVELALNHLETHFPEREFRVLDDDLTTARPIGFYDAANPNDVAWIWLLLSSTGDWRVWGIEWNRE